MVHFSHELFRLISAYSESADSACENYKCIKSCSKKTKSKILFEGFLKKLFFQKISVKCKNCRHIVQYKQESGS